MRAIVKEDILKYNFLSGITANEKGTDAVYVQQKASGNAYRADLWHVNAEGKINRLTRDGKSRGPVWDNDDTILFATRGGKGSKFKRMNVHTAQTEDAFEIAYPVMMLKKLSEGKYLIKAEVDLKKEGLTDEQIAAENDYIVVEEVPFYDNGAGYITRLRNTLFLFDEASGALNPITDKFFQTGAVDVMDGKIWYTGHAFTDLEQQVNGLYAYDIATGETETVIPEDHWRIGWIKNVNGTLFFSASDWNKEGAERHSDFYVLENGAMKFIHGNELGLYCNVSSDCRLGGGAGNGVYHGELAYIATSVSVCNLHTINAEGCITDLPPFPGSVDSFAVMGDKIIFIGMKNSCLQEIWQYENGEYKQLSKINTAALKGCYVGKPEYCGFIDRDGVQIDGWVIKPMDFDPEKKYPGVLSMHGGPRVAWGELFVHEMQMLAGAGYFVFFCNPRGSDGRGDTFGDLRGKYGDIDFKDFMDFCDHVLEQYPQLQADKLSAIGGSYGGFMANWMVGNTDRFAAIVSQRSFCNPLSDFGTSCIGYTFDRNEFQGTPWSDPWKLWDHAPLKYACNAVTPTLFIHSTEDYNCPLSEGLQMFTALKFHGCESKMVLFKGENHELSRSGKPLHRMRRLQEIQNWLDVHQK